MKRITIKTGLLTLAALIGISTSVQASDTDVYQGFSDFGDGDTGYAEVVSLTNQTIIRGFPDGSFKPNQPVLRRDAAVMLSRTLDLPESDIENPFPDIEEDAYYYAEALATYEAGIFEGSDVGFQPNDTLTREQMASILSRAFQLEERAREIPFTDMDDVASYHLDDVRKLYQNHITAGVSDTLFHPSGVVPRNHFSMFIYRALNDYTIPEEDEDEAEEPDEDTVSPNITAASVTLDNGERMEWSGDAAEAAHIEFDLQALPGATRFQSSTLTVTEDSVLTLTSSSPNLIAGFLPDEEVFDEGTNRLSVVDVLADNTVSLAMIRLVSSEIALEGILTNDAGEETQVSITFKL